MLRKRWVCAAVKSSWHTSRCLSLSGHLSAANWDDTPSSVGGVIYLVQHSDDMNGRENKYIHNHIWWWMDWWQPATSNQQQRFRAWLLHGWQRLRAVEYSNFLASQCVDIPSCVHIVCINCVIVCDWKYTYALLFQPPKNITPLLIIICMYAYSFWECRSLYVKYSLPSAPSNAALYLI